MHTLAICFVFWRRQWAYWHTQTTPHLSHNLPLPSQFSHQYQVILFGDSGTRCEHLAQGGYTAVSNQGVKRVTTWSQERCPAARRSRPLHQNIMHINDEKNITNLTATYRQLSNLNSSLRFHDLQQRLLFLALFFQWKIVNLQGYVESLAQTNSWLNICK